MLGIIFLKPWEVEKISHFPKEETYPARGWGGVSLFWFLVKYLKAYWTPHLHSYQPVVQYAPSRMTPLKHSRTVVIKKSLKIFLLIFHLVNLLFLVVLVSLVTSPFCLQIILLILYKLFSKWLSERCFMSVCKACTCLCLPCFPSPGLAGPGRHPPPPATGKRCPGSLSTADPQGCSAECPSLTGCGLQLRTLNPQVQSCSPDGSLRYMFLWPQSNACLTAMEKVSRKVGCEAKLDKKFVPLPDYFYPSSQ